MAVSKVMAFVASGILAVGVLTGCSSSSDAVGTGDSAGAQSIPATLDNMAGPWQLESGDVPAGRIKPVDGHPIELVIESDGTVTGNGGCNGIGTTVSADAGVVTFENVFQTLMACEDDVNLAETAFTTYLPLVTNGVIKGDSLVLTGEDIQMTFTKGES